jgi:hypothetical protein
MEIIYGTYEYFILLELRDRLNYSQYNKFDLDSLDKLRFEIHRKIEAIHIASGKFKNKQKTTL